MSIIRGIIAGEQDPQKLAKLRNYRIRASEAEIAKSLEGTWKAEHLFCLGQALSLHDTYRQLVAEADAQLEALMLPLRRQGTAAAKGNAKRGGKHAPAFDVREALLAWARLVFGMLTQGTEYVEQSQAEFEGKFQERTLKYLQKKAKTFGFDLVPCAV